MGSTRLPGKVMLKLKDKTVLAHVISRVKNAKGIDEVVVATTDKREDDVIEEESLQMNVKSFRGNELDVLDRYYVAAVTFKAEIVIRITADCPLLDATLLSESLQVFMQASDSEKKIDYLSVSSECGFPRGLDIEIFSMNVLQNTWNEASLAHQREHVTSYIYENPELFNLVYYQQQTLANLSHYRWTLDTKEDFELISTIYNELYTEEHCFSTDDILELLQQKPWLTEINKNVKQKK